MMASKIDRTYKTTFTGEAITMDKYTELLKDIANLIANTDRESFLLGVELRDTKEKLAAAEVKIAHSEKALAEAHEQIETLVARRAVEMMQEDEASA